MVASSLIFSDNNKNKNIINIYSKIIKQLTDEVFSLIDEFEDQILSLLMI